MAASLRFFSAGSVDEPLCDVGRARGKSLAEIDLGNSVYPCLLLEHEQTYRKRNAMSPNDPKRTSISRAFGL